LLLLLFGRSGVDDLKGGIWESGNAFGLAFFWGGATDEEFLDGGGCDNLGDPRSKLLVGGGIL